MRQFLLSVKLFFCSGLLWLAGPATAQVAFGPATAYLSGGQGAYSIVLSDLNGDGKPDIVVLNATSGTVGVLLNNGRGGFITPAATYATGGNSGTFGLATSDVNGDGRPDIVVSNSAARTVNVLLNASNGTFPPTATSYSTGATSQPLNVAVADVNGDSYPDVLVPNPLDKTVGVLLGNGTGSYPTLSSYPAGNYAPRTLTVGDVNHDGKPDIVFTLSANGTFEVMLNTGNGAFALMPNFFGTGTNFQTGSSNQTIYLFDINGDGALDVVSPNPYANALSLVPNSGTVIFPIAYVYPLGGGTVPTATAIGDVNQDGYLDLVLAYSGSHAAAVLLGQGGTNFPTPALLYPTGSGSTPRDVALADVNGDGKLDIITANYGTGTVGVQLNTTVLATQSTLAEAASAPYPNPAHEAFAVQVPPVAGARLVRAELRNAMGQLVLQQVAPLSSTGTRLLVATASLPAGVYALHLLAGSEALVHRVVVE